MKIAVLIKQVPDTWGDRKLDLTTGRVDRQDGDQVIDEINERALEVALSYRDQHKSSEIVAVTAGPSAANDALRKALAIGADSGLHVVDDQLSGADAMATSAALAAAIASGGFDLVIAGNVSTDGRGGTVPAMVAERLGAPQLSALDEIEITDDQVSGVRTTDFGTQRVHADLPAVVTVTERMIEARFPSFKNIMSAKKKTVSAVSLADLGATLPLGRSVVLSTRQRPPRDAGRIVVDEGRAGIELADFLAAEHLI